jgi:hypothetical protein
MFTTANPSIGGFDVRCLRFDVGTESKNLKPEEIKKEGTKKLRLRNGERVLICLRQGFGVTCLHRITAWQAGGTTNTFIGRELVV